jgi:rubredoxin
MSWKCPACGGICAEENLEEGKHGIICPLCGSESEVDIENKEPEETAHDI